jgi:hypothetical protein
LVRAPSARVFGNSNGIESFSPALTRQRLRWVHVQNHSSTLKELNHFAIALVTAPDLKTARSFLIEFHSVRAILPA